MKINIDKFNRDFKGKVSSLQKAIPQVRLYEMDLSVFAAKQAEIVEDTDCNASFTKACVLNTSKDGLRSPGFWAGFYPILMGNNFEFEGFALSNAVGSTECVMQFLPGGCTKVAARLVTEIAQAHLGKTYEVVLLNGDTTSNEKAEALVNDTIKAATEVGKKVWVISAGMASRSFSVPAIDTVLLTYDEGDLGATLQKLSRAFTADSSNYDKTGKVVSISIAPRRIDKVAQIILDAASKDSRPLEEALKRAHATFPLFSVDQDGCQCEIKEDEYLRRAMSLTASKALSVQRANVIELDEKDAEELVREILLKVNRSSRTGEKGSYSDKGKRYITTSRGSNVSPVVNPRQVLLAQLDGFVNNLEYARWFVDDDSVNLRKVLEAAESSKENTDYFITLSGMTPESVRKVIDLGLIKETWVDMVLLQTK